MHAHGQWIRRALVGLVTLVSLLGSTGCLPTTSAPIQVWAVEGQDLLAAGTPPVPESKLFTTAGREIRLGAAINETIAFQLGLRTSAPAAGPFVVEVSDLAGDAGTLTSSENVSLYRVRGVRVERFESWYPEHTGRPATPTAFPDILVPWDAPRGGGPVTLRGSASEVVWVDLRVPPTTNPGIYTGRLVVRTAGKQTTSAFECDIRLRVYPVALPSEPSLPVVCRVDPRDLLVTHLDWPREQAELTRLLPDDPAHAAAVGLVSAAMREFQAHRVTPVLWASFPKYRPVGERRVEVDWELYDRLVEGWLDGSAFEDQVGLSHWPIPISREYPDADREGGLSAPGYARLASAYLQECRRHFEERGWLARAFVRPCPPEPLTKSAVRRVQRLGEILRQSETALPLMAHLPARSLRGLGWRDAPDVELPDVSMWAPLAMWFEPEAMRAQRALGRQTWLRPDHPPYSSTLGVEGLPTDARALPWQAQRYDAGGVWIEHAAEFGTVTSSIPATKSGEAESLIYPGAPFGLPDRPVPSIRLKRLRQGLQDHALLQLLQRRGKRVLAQSTAEQVVRWACTEACLDHLLSCKQTGWPRDARVFALARELVLHELTHEIAPESIGDGDHSTRLAEWGLLMNQATRVRVAIEGVRLSPAGERLKANVFWSTLNYTNRAIEGRWVMPTVPIGWEPPAAVAVTMPPDTRRQGVLEPKLAGLAYNTEGVYPFALQFETARLGTFAAPARLAVAAAPLVARPPTVDGELSDWALASNNAAGSFWLVRGRREGATPGSAAQPTLPTQAFFCMDSERLYVAIRCWLADGQKPLWRADNLVPLDGAVPWGQDVVEILIDPRQTIAGTSADVYALQIKPNGVLVARHGCRTEPMIGESESWESGARVAARVESNAWVVELSLPLAALGRGAVENGIWGLNITRLDARRGEYSSWSGARGQCYSPQSLGNLLLVRP